MPHIITGFLLLGTFVTMAHADIYQCPDNTGKVFYQNRPCHDSTKPVLTTPPRSTPRPALPAPRAATPAAGSATAPPLARATRPAAEASPVESRLVDTHQLALIQPGMGRAEVKRRLGPPQSIVAQESEAREKSARKVRNQVEHWHYPGNSVVPPAVIVFKNGTVESRGRAGQELRRSVSDVLHRR